MRTSFSLYLALCFLGLTCIHAQAQQHISSIFPDTVNYSSMDQIVDPKPPPPSLSLRIGPGFYARQDQIFSPFVHKDWSFLNIALQYDWGIKNPQFVGFEFGSYNPILVPEYTYGEDNDDETYPHSFTLVNLTYGLGKNLVQKNPKNSIVLGGFFEADVDASNYSYAWVSHFGYMAPFSLGVWGAYQHPFSDKNKLTGKVLLPLVSLVARSPYLINDDEFIENTYSHNGLTTFFEYLADGDIETLNKIQQLELQLGYQHALSEKWSIGGLYSFRFMHASEPLNFLSYRHTFYINLTHLF